MKLLNRMVLVALIAWLALSGLQAAQKDDGGASAVREAAKLILSNSSKQEEVHRGLVYLLDTAIKIAAKDAQLPLEFQNKLQAAAKLFAKNPLAAESSAALNGAYKIVNGGKDFTFPKEVRNIGDASRIAQQHIDQSVKALEGGQAHQAVGDILALILLVTTPMMKQP
jgi:hypothetical protein